MEERIVGIVDEKGNTIGTLKVIDDDNIRTVNKEDYTKIYHIALKLVAHDTQFGVALDTLYRYQKIYEGLKQNLGQNIDITKQVEYMQSQGISINLLKQLDYTSEDGQFIRGIAESYIVYKYTLWEEVYRPEIANILGIKKCKVKSDLMGDFRLLRHNILHHEIKEKDKIPDNLKTLGKYWQENSQEPIVSNRIKIPIRTLLREASNFDTSDIQPKLRYIRKVNGEYRDAYPEPVSKHH